jgi:hypothetical protein
MTTTSTLKYWPLPKRHEFLKALTKPVGNQELEFPKGTLRNFEVFVVPLEVPVYRLDNGRTLMDQQEYLVKNDKPADFFTKDPDSLEALQAQDDLLRGMVAEAGLLKYFRKRKQLEALILSEDGRVINGNRRLCTMRLLYQEDSVEFAHFGHIRVIVLPNSKPDDIDELEARLQLHEDIKADYAWISEALIFKTRQERHGIKLADVASFYEVSEKLAREKIQMLAYADRYLQSRGRDKRYRELVKKEYAFKQLCKYRLKINNAEDGDVFTELVFSLIDRPAVNARQYSQIPLIQERLTRFKSKLGGELQVEPVAPEPVPATPKVTPVTDPTKGPSDEELLAGSAQPQANTGSLIAALIKPDNRDRVNLIVQDLVEEAQEEKKQRDIENACLDNVSDAHTCMETAIGCLTPESKITGIEIHLKNIEDKVRALREKIQSYGKN